MKRLKILLIKKYKIGMKKRLDLLVRNLNLKKQKNFIIKSIQLLNKNVKNL